MTNINSGGGAAAKHTAMRTCVGCRRVQPKRRMVRVVSTADGGIEIDDSGRKAGRGAYLCRDLSCWESSLRGERLGHALRSSLTGDKREQLISQAKELLGGAD